jgi:hypothetical protein
MSVPVHVVRRQARIVVHRRTVLSPSEVTRHDGIPVTSPIVTLIDIAAQLEREQLEAAINEADKRSLTDPDELRSALDELTSRPGIGKLRETLDRRLRFMRAQVRFEPAYVRTTLLAVAHRLG